MKKRNILSFGFVLFFIVVGYGQTIVKLQEKFDHVILLEKIGRGVCEVKGNLLKTQGAYVLFGENNWKNYEITFRARTPKNESQVQIWSGFRAANRNDRYVIGFRGGLQNDIFLARMGYMGADEFLDRKSLNFNPQPGEWYSFKIDVCQNRIRIFINNESIPRIDLVDTNSDIDPAGKVILGGGWLKTEYDDLTIKDLPDNFFSNIPVSEFKQTITDKQKELKSEEERKTYKPIVLSNLNPTRTEIPLDGNWLFLPDYQLSDEQKAVSPETDDQSWHIMNVPDFWNPIRIWLHGETFDGHPKGVSDLYYQKETQRCENYTFDYKKTKMAWYRQWVELPKNIGQKQSELVFDAVSKIAEVWINGQKF